MKSATGSKMTKHHRKVTLYNGDRYKKVNVMNTLWESRCCGCGIYKPDTAVALCDRCLHMESCCDANPKIGEEEQMWDEAMKMSDDYIEQINLGEDA